MTKKTRIMVILSIVLAISGCAGMDVQGTDTSGIQANVTNKTQNMPDQPANVTVPKIDDISMAFNLKKPPKEVIGGD